MPFPSPEDASGVWSLRDVCKHQETAAWPGTKLEVQYVVVGGGGGGGVIGGGGGGGGIRANWNNKNVSRTWPYIAQTEPRMFLTPGNYPVIVGIGGNSGQQYTPATNGGDSSFNGIVGFGGGGGGNHVSGTLGKNNRGRDGGSGGGGSDNSTPGGVSLHRPYPGYQVPRPIVVHVGRSYTSRNTFPATGQSYYIYRAADTSLMYLWSGTAYVQTAQINITGVDQVTSVSGGRKGQPGSYLYQETQRYGGPGGGFGSSGASFTQDAGAPLTWIYSPNSFTDGPSIRLGAGGGGGGYLNTNGGSSITGGGGSVNSGYGGASLWMNSSGLLSNSTIGAGQVGDNLIGGYGQPNRGGGGGGCSWQNPPITRHGGSGVVIIRYHGLQQATGGEIQTSTGLFRFGWTTHVFNSSGVFTVNSTANTGPLFVNSAPAI